jgi:hypothetical protein
MSEETYAVRRKNQINRKSEVVNVNVNIDLPKKENISSSSSFELVPKSSIQNLIIMGPTGPTGPEGPAGLTGATGPKSDSYLTIYKDELVIPNVGDSVDILIEKELAYSIGQHVIISHDILHYFYGEIVNYDRNSGYLHINVTQVKGSGKLRLWYVNIAGPNSMGFTGPEGPEGPTGPLGPTGPVGPSGLGLRSYAYFYTDDVYAVSQDSIITFNKFLAISDDITMSNNLIVIGSDGVYNITFYISTDSNNQFCLDINGENLIGSIYNSNSTNQGNVITQLKAGDLISLKNIGNTITLKKQILINNVTSSITLLKLS